jgi:hypothetical protein
MVRAVVIIGLVVVVGLPAFLIGRASIDSSPTAAPAATPLATLRPRPPMPAAADWSAFQNFDDVGVVMVPNPVGEGLVYNPLTIMHYAGVMFAHGDDAAFLTQVAWLMDHRAARGDCIAWEYDWDYPPFKAEAPWISGMALGNGLINMLQAHWLTGSQEYLDVAAAVANCFALRVEEGGVLRPGGWYEEYASPGSTFTKVLNGHISATISLRFYAEYTDGQEAMKLYEQGLAVVLRDLPEFDLDGWTAYDATGRPAPTKYHDLVRRQIWYLATVTGDPVLYEYARRFERGTPP